MLGLGASITTPPFKGVAAGFTNTKSLSLDGTGDAFDPQFSTAQLQTLLRASHTYSIWVKMPWDASGTIIGYGDSGSFVAGGFKLDYLYFNSVVDAINVSGKFGGGAWTGTTLINNAATDDADAWVHFCITQTKGASSGDAGSYIFYINGSAATGSIATPTNAYQESTEVTSASGVGMLFGAEDAGGTAQGHMTGKIDEIAIWVVALDADAVAAIYNSGVPIDLTEDSGNYDNSNRLRYYYRLEDDKLDTQGNSNGTVAGNPAFSTDIPE
jgi:hypothetical protein